jgi:hypothetical protein
MMKPVIIECPCKSVSLAYSLPLFSVFLRA